MKKRSSRKSSGDAVTSLGSPHRNIRPESPRDRFALELLDALWLRYRQRVQYVQTYERVVEQAGATFENDHIAFRTLALQEPTAGIVSVARAFEALGYRARGCYQFPDKHLCSIHYQHSCPGFPKVFVSELHTWELPADVRKIVWRCVRSHRAPLSDKLLAAVIRIGEQPRDKRDRALKTLTRWFHELPWEPPSRKDVLHVNEATQFGAWTLVHGYNVNHFTALINSHGVETLDSIDKTADALRAAGVPMKSEIEGDPGSRLRQTATQAVTLEVRVTDKGRTTRLPWTYAYFELAERGQVVNPDTGQVERFEGFLGPQATQLFEMTRVQPAAS
jgi:hypothetical protein